MDLKSVSGFTCYVKDIKKTAEFYKALGFKLEKQEADYLLVRLNWFGIDFRAAGSEDKAEFQKEAVAEPKGAGIFINVSVGDVDEFYKGVLAKGLKPSSEPRDWPWGTREFVIRDPDGYKLVIFKRGKPRSPAE
jgi:catechol 2,3-dioxygenase-like lactoylglutathione lyase family enzyme